MTSPRAARASASSSARSPGISPRTLSLRLRALEEEGIVERDTYPEVPPRVEYALTEKGRALLPIIDDARLRRALARRGVRDRARGPRRRRRVASSAWPRTTATATGWSTPTPCCEAPGLRATAGRSAVVEHLARQRCLVTAQEIVDALRGDEHHSASTATVYRALETLHEFGLVRRFDAGEGVARYEPVDPSGDHHHHVVFDDGDGGGVRGRRSSRRRSTGSRSGSASTSPGTT